MNYERHIIGLIANDDLRMRALRAVRVLDLPDWLIAAGFVRNKIWDSVFNTNTQLTDVDVIYFCTADISAERDCTIEQRLLELEPNIPWSVKNQVRMHHKNGDQPYRDTLDAMRYWPEQQTSIGVKLSEDDNIVLQHCFDLHVYFDGHITRNPARSIETFRERISSKEWLAKWPLLKIEI